MNQWMALALGVEVVLTVEVEVEQVEVLVPGARRGMWAPSASSSPCPSVRFLPICVYMCMCVHLNVRQCLRMCT
jgi:hypothetical protein